jgi:hypothetical protein
MLQRHSDFSATLAGFIGGTSVIAVRSPAPTAANIAAGWLIVMAGIVMLPLFIRVRAVLHVKVSIGTAPRNEKKGSR